MRTKVEGILLFLSLYCNFTHRTNAMRRTEQYKPLINPAFTNDLPFFLFLSRAALALFLMGDINNLFQDIQVQLAQWTG